MKTFIKKMVTTVSVFLLVAAPGTLAVTMPVHADIAAGVCQGVVSTGTDSCVEDDADEGFAALMTRIINIFSIVVGAISVIMIIIGGFRYIISAGDSNGVSGAKNTILYAVVGLVIVLFAQVIVRFVLTNVSPS